MSTVPGPDLLDSGQTLGSGNNETRSCCAKGDGREDYPEPMEGLEGQCSQCSQCSQYDRWYGVVIVVIILLLTWMLMPMRPLSH